MRRQQRWQPTASTDRSQPELANPRLTKHQEYIDSRQRLLGDLERSAGCWYHYFPGGL
jgi:hypothetical protein